MNNKVCIILPVYNTDSVRIKRCLNHLLSKRFEVIVVDDCSNNIDTINCLDEYKNIENIHLIRNSINLGAGGARRNGIKCLINNEGFGANYFGFIDCDDEIDEKEYLEFVDEVSYRGAKTGLARIECYLPELPKVGFKSRSYKEKNTTTNISSNPYMVKMGPSILNCRLFAIDLAEKFDVEFKAKAYEDTEILYYIVALANSIYISNKTVYKYYMHFDSLFFTNMRVTSSNCLKQILISSTSRNNHFKEAGIYDVYKEPLNSLELSYYLQRIKAILQSKEIINKPEIAAHGIKLISKRIDNYQDYFQNYQSPFFNNDKQYNKYTEINDMLNNYRALVIYKKFANQISEYISSVPDKESEILASYDNCLKLKR